MNGVSESVFVSETKNVGSVDRTGRVSRPVRDGGVSSSAIRRERDVTLRGRRAQAHLPCKDNGVGEVTTGAPVPASVPGDFTVLIGAVLAGRTERGMRAGMEALGGLEAGYATLLNVLSWVEVVFARCREVREDGGRLRGQVMALGAAMVGTW